MLTKYDYEKIAEDVSDAMIHDSVPMNESIKSISIQINLNPEQIKRVAEASNIKAYNKVYDSKDDKTFTFELADSKKIIDDVYSDADETGDKVETEIKDMQPVEFKAEKNPTAPQETFERLGDRDEIEVSKNTANAEDAAGDSFIDALKIPKKDYSADADEIAEEGPSEEEVEKTKKEASLKLKFKTATEEREIKEARIKVAAELDERLALCEDGLEDQMQGLSSMFRGVDKHQKFAKFAYDAQLSGREYLGEILTGLVGRCAIDTSKTVKVGSYKVLAGNEYGLEKLAKVVESYKLKDNILKAQDLLRSM